MEVFKVSKGWLRLLLVGYLVVLAFAFHDTLTTPHIGDILLVVFLASVEYWGAVVILTWLINGFRKK